MNRIAYRLFRLYGPNLQFSMFLEDLKTLQCGTFEQALDLWLRLTLETEEAQTHASRFEQNGAKTSESLNFGQFVTIDKVTKMLAASYPQSVQGDTRFERLVKKMFTHGLDTCKSISALHESVLQDPELRSLFECVLQFK